jgi:hypothetical protein
MTATIVPAAQSTLEDAGRVAQDRVTARLLAAIARSLPPRWGGLPRVGW